MTSPQQPSYTSGIRDNRRRGAVGAFLREELGAGDRLAVVSAYFTIHAFDALRDSLSALGEVDFLFGEPRFVKQMEVKQEDRESVIQDKDIKLNDTLKQDKIAKACEAWIREKVNIRSVKQSNLLHGKLYHIEKVGGREAAILGSSNFTLRGLGLGEQNNIELNLVVDSDRDRRDLKAWFQEIWNDDQLVTDVKEDVIAYLQQVYQDQAPEFVYYKTLYHIFKTYLDRKDEDEALLQQTHFYETKIWRTLYPFQRQGVISLINKIRQFNGCILADSVGLGKTFTALAVIKYFELRNEKVLVLCPKKLRQNWEIYQASQNSELNFLLEDRFGYTLLAHTDLSREGGYASGVNLETFNWGNFDLVVIDESHNFRNNTKGKRDEEGNLIRRSRYERLMEDILKGGVKTKVLLLSATPVNTDLKDLRNQIYLITQNQDGAFQQSLNIVSIQQTLSAAQQEFKQWSRQETLSAQELYQRLSAAFFALLDGLTLARSRGHLERYYQSSLGELGDFPQRLAPVSVYSPIDSADNFPDYHRIYEQVSGYQLSLFNPSRYILAEYHERYANLGGPINFSQENREFYLIGMMKVNFLKRLESSIFSFRITLERTIQKIKALEDKLKKFQQEYSSPHPKSLSQEGRGTLTPLLPYPERSRRGEKGPGDEGKKSFKTGAVEDEDLQIQEEEDEELMEAWTVGKTARFELQHLNIDAWLEDLGRDRRQLHGLFLQSQDVDGERDAKLGKLKELIAAKVQAPTVNKKGELNRKVLVFTAFADTARYLYDHLRDWARQDLGIHAALVTGGENANQTTFGSRRFEHILTHFSPRSKQRVLLTSLPQGEEIDLLIATDCISEGQNLQDCDYLINYDIHWNPVRIIQRFGRIDRLGSLNSAARLVNFWPVPDLNQYINLKNRVEARMALVDLAATGEDNVLTPAEQERQIREEMTYRDQQLLRLQNEVLDLEDFSQAVSLTEFTLDDFRMDLLNYLDQHQRALEAAPLGIYGVVPGKSGAAEPGLIFCLEQGEGEPQGEDSKAVNPLQPYFLVYVTAGGEVRYTFSQPKRILELFRGLCAGQRRPYEELCRLFDRATENGSNMARENALLSKALDSIQQTLQRRAAQQLFTMGKGGFVPTSALGSNREQFRLVTWLVIVDGQQSF